MLRSTRLIRSALISGEKHLSTQSTGKLMYDFNHTVEDYRRYRNEVGLNQEFYHKLFRYGVGLEGQKILNLESNGGAIARGFALRGIKDVTATDSSATMTEHARTVNAAYGVEIRCKLAAKEQTGEPDNSYDVVITDQAWYWEDSSDVFAEITRILRPDGKLVVAYNDWMPDMQQADNHRQTYRSVTDLTADLLRQHDPSWRPMDMYRMYLQPFRDVTDAYYVNAKAFKFVLTEEGVSHEFWRGRIRTSPNVSLAENKMLAFDQEHAEALKKHFPEAGLKVPNMHYALVATRPSMFLSHPQAKTKLAKPTEDQRPSNRPGLK